MCHGCQYSFTTKSKFRLTLESRNPITRAGFNNLVLLVRVDKTYFQMIQFSEGAYFAFPPDPTLTSTLAEFKGVGIFNITLFAYSLGEKLALTLILYSTRVLPISVTTGCTLNGRFTLSVVRYLMYNWLVLTTRASTKLEDLLHQFEFSIGRYKTNGSIIIKFTQLDTLVELTIINLDCIGTTCSKTID